MVVGLTVSRSVTMGERFVSRGRSGLTEVRGVVGVEACLGVAVASLSRPFF